MSEEVDIRDSGGRTALALHRRTSMSRITSRVKPEDEDASQLKFGRGEPKPGATDRPPTRLILFISLASCLCSPSLRIRTEIRARKDAHDQ